MKAISKPVSSAKIAKGGSAVKLSATTTKFISSVAKDYPDFTIERGPHEHWSPKKGAIIFNPSQTPERIRFSVLHELAHALLDHADYQSDFELLKMESEAWHLASKIGLRYGVTISEDHIQNCLDTYRDWLHHRSQCPTCDMHVLQESSSYYKCFNCQTAWKVSSGRFVRPYRRATSKK